MPPRIDRDNYRDSHECVVAFLAEAVRQKAMDVLEGRFGVIKQVQRSGVRECAQMLRSEPNPILQKSIRAWQGRVQTAIWLLTSGKPIDLKIATQMRESLVLVGEWLDSVYVQNEISILAWPSEPILTKRWDGVLNNEHT